MISVNSELHRSAGIHVLRTANQPAICHLRNLAHLGAARSPGVVGGRYSLSVLLLDTVAGLPYHRAL